MNKTLAKVLLATTHKGTCKKCLALKAALMDVNE